MSNFPEQQFLTEGNTGVEGIGTDQGIVTGLVLTDDPLGIATATLAKVLATWTENFQAARALRWYPIGDFNMFESDENTDNIEEGDLGNDAYLNTVSGENRFHAFIEPDQLSIGEVSDTAKVLNFGKKYAYIIYQSGMIKGWSDDGTYFKPFPLGYARMTFDSQPTKDKTQHGIVRWKLKDSNLELYNSVPIYPKPTFDPNIDFKGLINTNIVATATAPTVTTVEVDVTTDNSNTGVSGLAADGSDFVITVDLDSSEVTPSGAVEDANVSGRYVLTFATQIAGGYTASFVASSAMTTEGYEQISAAASFTIPA